MTAAEPPPVTLRDLAARLQHDDLDLGTYTDEELLAVTLAVPDEARLVPLSTVGELDAAGRDVAVRTAVRSLVARGLAAPVAGGAAAGEVDEMEVYGELAVVLDVLAHPSGVTLADRELHDEVTQRVWFGVDDVAVLDQEPVGGLHRFTLRRRDRAAESLAAFVDPQGWAARDGDPLRHDPDRPPPVGWDAVDRATRDAVLSVRLFTTGGSPSDEREAAVAGSPDGMWVLSARADGCGVVVQAAEVSTASLLGVATVMIGRGATG